MILDDLQKPNSQKPRIICGLTIYPGWDPALHTPEENKILDEQLEDIVKHALWRKEHPVKLTPEEEAHLKTIRERHGKPPTD